MQRKTTPSRRRVAHCLIALLTFLLSATGILAQQAGTSPVKIFILAGQSNMLGQGNMTPVTTPGTLEYTVANDPGGDYQFLVDGGGSWVVRDDVWIRDQDPSQGGLTVGYGSQPTTIGPELGFGHFVGDLQENQVLIVKAGWGGKSLGFDFLPPSSESYPAPQAPGDKGFYYQEILRLVSEATTNLGTYFPDYDGQGYEIAGFGWHQGWNDRVTPAFSAEYETNMANFIRDIRTDLGAPGLPFVIATTGMDGGTSYTEVELAQLAMANATAYPEFDGNVAVIDTRVTYEGLEFWQPVGQSPQNQGYHWNRNAKTYVNIGLAMADAMSLMVPGRCPFRPRATGSPGGVTLGWQNGTDTPTSVRILRNGTEIAAAAPADPPAFLDATAEPGVLNYELIFTMPGDPCDPLTTTLNGAITGLELSPSPGSFTLTWTNNMAYDAIEVRRDGTLLTGALSGTATTYTDSSPPAAGLVTYSVAPTNGSSTPATVQINLDLSGQLGILDLTANGGINPNTGVAWQVGDQYRLAFHTVGSTGTRNARSNDPADYNNYVTAEAHANPALAGSTWFAMVAVNLDGSTTQALSPKSHVKDNTGTADLTGGAGIGGAGFPVYAMDGTTCIARNNADIWNDWSNPFDGDSTIRVTAPPASQAVHYSPFLDQFGNQTVTPDNVHGIDVATGAGSNGADINPLGDTTDNTTINRGNANANNSARVWNRFTNNTTDNLSYYALSEPLTVMAGGSDYTAWAGTYPDADLTDPDADLDGDGLTNNEERVWGLDPTSAASMNPYSVPLDPDAGTFSYTRRDPTLSELTYTVWTSTNLQPGSWVQDTGTGASQVPGTPNAFDVETVAVTLSAALLDKPQLFVRIQAAK